jgi:translation initiation factor IF-1
MSDNKNSNDTQNSNELKGDKMQLQGKIIEPFPGTFKVLLENGNEVIAYISGKMRKNKIKVVVGDTVTVEVGIADLTKGIIKHRHNPPKSFS